MLKDLKKQVYQANMLLPMHGLVVFTWGNVSGIDRGRGLVVIKPSGVEYDSMTEDDMVVVELDSGKTVDSRYKPSSDTATHLELYKNFPNIGGVAHTHSRYATVFAQVKRPIPALGTTHADHFYGDVPCTRLMSPAQIAGQYERETGLAIIDTFRDRCADDMPAVLVAGHGPFTWGTDARDAAHNSVVLEEVAAMAWHCLMLDPSPEPIQSELLDRHFFRKHGKNAYYGQYCSTN